MSESARIADLLKKEMEARGSASPRERRAALVEVLRKELDALPPREVNWLLAEVRSQFAPKDDDGEAAGVWEWLLHLDARREPDTGRQTAAAPAAPAHAAPRSAAAPQAAVPTPASGLARLMKAVMGTYFPADAPITPEAEERFERTLDLIFGMLEMHEEQSRMMSAEIRKGTMLAGRSGGTISDLKRGDRLRKVIARAVLSTGDPTELSKRLKSFGATPLLVYSAHHASVRRASESVRRLIDPQVIQKEHGRAAWEAYRRVWHNELHDFDASFQAQFVEEPFIQEYFKEFDKL